jgi:hypothetical protein
MHEHAGTAAAEGEQKKRREEGAGAARVVSNGCPGGRQPSRENAHLCALSATRPSQLVTVARHSRFVRSVSTLVSASTLGPTLCVVTSALFTCRFPTAASRPIALGGHGDGDSQARPAPRARVWGCGGAY